jgi:hypothetical protein
MRLQSALKYRESLHCGAYSIFDIYIQEPLAYARGTATATVRERLNTQVEIALNYLKSVQIEVVRYQRFQDASE